MDTRDIYKLVRELSEERDDVINLYDSMDIELSEGFVIETGVVGFTEDGVIVHLDEDAMEFLDFNGVLLESEDVMEDSGSADAAYDAVINRITRQHLDLLSKFGPAAVMAAVEDVTGHLTDLEEIGSSDVSIWVREVIKDLEAGHYKDLHEGGLSGMMTMEDFLELCSESDDVFELIYNAIAGDYGEEVRKEMQDRYDDIVIDSQGRLHPDDDFEDIIGLMIDQLDADAGPKHNELDELSAIKKLAGHEEVDEGLGKALLGGAALIAAITGINKVQADHLMKTEPQLIKLAQMRQEAEKKGDEYQVQSLDDRIQKTLDHIRVTGRPVMGPDGKPVVPGEPLGEAEYQGRKVQLNKPMAGDVKKSKVYVKKPNGKVVKVNFGDKNMKIKKSNPARRKSFRARHNCENPGPKWKARYWSCRAW